MDSFYGPPTIVLAVVAIIIVLAVRRAKRRAKQEQVEEEKRIGLEAEQSRKRMVQFRSLIGGLIYPDTYSSDFFRDLKFLDRDNKNESDVAAAKARVLAFKLGRRIGQVCRELWAGPL